MSECKTQLSLGDEITCLISTKGVLSKYDVDDSREIANELVPLIESLLASARREAKREVLEKAEQAVRKLFEDYNAKSKCTKFDVEEWVGAYKENLGDLK